MLAKSSPAVPGLDEKHVAKLLEDSPHPAVVLDRCGTFVSCNQASLDLLNMTPDAMIGRGLHEITVSEAAGSEWASLMSGRRWSGDISVARSDGVRIPLYVNRSPIFDRAGRVVGVLSQAARRTGEVEANAALHARRIADAALRESEQKFRRVVEHSTDAFLSVDLDDHIRDWNPAAEAMFGWTSEEAVGRDLADLLLPVERLTWRGRFERERSGDPPGRIGSAFEMVVVSATGRQIPVEVSVVQDSTDGQPHFQAFVRDIAERKSAEARLATEALSDPLTQLPNRALMHNRLTMAVSRLARHHGTLAVMFLDVDRFKLVNDGLGHDAGDELLVTIGDRIQRSIRTIDTVARYGGDEFVVVAADLSDPGEPAAIAERVIAAVGEAVEVAGHVLTPSISAGITLTQSDDRTADDLIRDADVAMYKAKERGGGRYVIFDEEMGREARSRLLVEEDLRRAIDGGELRVHYQPIVTLAGQIRGVEALVRWQHPCRGLVPPMDFIPLAEETELIVKLGAWVLEEACRQVATWRATGSPSLELSVNVATRQLADPSLPATVKDVLARTGLEPSALCLEITESGLLSEPEPAAASLRALNEIGIKVAVDDFGTGYSSLLYLRRFPVQILKLDRLFVAGISDNRNDAAIVGSVVNLAHSLGMSAVAEGVETAEQRAVLEDLGCEEAQGFLWSPARAPDALSELLDASGRLPALSADRVPAWPQLAEL